jgi:hypothetical protein
MAASFQLAERAPKLARGFRQLKTGFKRSSQLQAGSRKRLKATLCPDGSSSGAGGEASQTGPAGHQANWLLVKLDRTRRLEQAPKTSR